LYSPSISQGWTSCTRSRVKTQHGKTFRADCCSCVRLCFHNDQVPYMHPMSSKTTFCRWGYRLLFKDLWHADKKQDRDALAKPLQSILQEVEGIPVVKTKVLHLFRSVQLSKLYSQATQHNYYALRYITKQGRQLTRVVQRQWSYLAGQWWGGQ